jgi:hypothetical protein
MADVPEVLSVCTHNAGRSQIGAVGERASRPVGRVLRQAVLDIG